MEKATEQYINQVTSEDKLNDYFSYLDQLGFSTAVNLSRERIRPYQVARQTLKQARNFSHTKSYAQAIIAYRQVLPNDAEDYQIALTEMKTTMEEMYNDALSSAQVLATNQLYKDADSDLAAKLAYYRQAQNRVPYRGPIQYIFFHPLIVYPELAFDNDSQSNGFNQYFVTVSEFKKILDSLYKNNFILVDIHSIYGEKNDSKKTVVTPKELLFFSITPKGQTVISRDHEIIPILDQFVTQHPDFSLNGAKGLIALTGYEGILGYRTNELDSPNFKNEKSQALAVVKRLKETGWSFASHGWGHLDARKISLSTLMNDTKRWLAEVEPLIGPIVYPFGSSILPGDAKFQYLQDVGFHALCSVGPNPYLKFGPFYLMMDRRHIDGIAFLTEANPYRYLFNSGDIVDKARPRLK